MAHVVKNLPAVRETQVQSLGWEDLEKVRATHFSIPGASLMPQMAKNLYSSHQFTR